MINVWNYYKYQIRDMVKEMYVLLYKNCQTIDCCLQMTISSTGQAIASSRKESLGDYTIADNVTDELTYYKLQPDGNKLYLIFRANQFRWEVDFMLLHCFQVFHKHR